MAPYYLLTVHFSPVSHSLMSGLAFFIFLVPVTLVLVLLPSSSVNYSAWGEAFSFFFFFLNW